MTVGKDAKSVELDEFLLWRFQMEVNRQCKFALTAVDDMDLGKEEENSRFWYSMQAFLSAAANVSKLLWGATQDIERERAPLRKSLEVSDNSPLRSRVFRNHFDHFDERLGSWFKDWSNAGLQGGSDTEVGDIDDLDISEFALRNFDTKTKTLIFRGEALPLAPLFVALVELEEKAVTALRDFLITNALPVNEDEDS